MKKAKTFNVFMKIRAALRNIYRFSPMRREAIKRVGYSSEGTLHFTCVICEKRWPIQMAEVDHIPPLGPLADFFSLQRAPELCDLGPWAKQLFYGPVRVICKLCHKKVTASQRKKKT